MTKARHMKYFVTLLNSKTSSLVLYAKERNRVTIDDYQVKYWDQSSIMQGVKKFKISTLRRESACSPFRLLAVYCKEEAQNLHFGGTRLST